MALVENIQRHDLDPIEIALSYQRLIDEIQLTQEQMSERVGKNNSTIAIIYAFKTRSDHPDRIRDGFISMGHGRAIINIEFNIQTDIYQNSQSKPVRSRYGSFSKKLSGKSKTETSGQDKGIVSI
jgi:ParB family chromosome partitioning protein